MKQKVLVSFNGKQDPFTTTKTGDHIDGPILTLLNEKDDFARFILFSSGLLENAQATKKVIEDRYPRMIVEIYELDIPDPTHYPDILKALRPALATYCPPDPSVEYAICVSPGTPQEHACWLLMAASAEITAKILQVKQPGIAGDGHSLVREILPRGPEFPDVIPRARMEEVPEFTIGEMEQAIREAEIVGKDPAFLKALEDAGRLAQYDRTPIMILGETGTGKELFAKYIHRIGIRKNKDFIPENCSAYPEHLIESILFGYVKGAFTGADEDREGKFHVANKGTLFLDEIGDMPLSAQAKVLRALNDGEVFRVGAREKETVDVQVIAATNKDVYQAMEEDTFRSDLFFRLGEGIIVLPSLAERRGDIPLLAQELLRQCNHAFNKSAVLTQDSLAYLQKLPWPGNIRELKNVIYRTVKLAKQNIITPEDILLDRSLVRESGIDVPEPREGFNINDYLKSLKIRIIERALEITEGNQTRAAALLGISSQAVSQYVTGKSRN